MSANRAVYSFTVGFLLITCARLAAAQTYIWTDERGVVHAAADPSEVPAKYREKSVQNASKATSGVKIVPDQPVPAAPAARSSDPTDPSTSAGGAGIQANPHATPQPADPSAKVRKDKPEPGPYGLPPADEGFEWNCSADLEGGPPHCQQLEKKHNKRSRREEARDTARRELGVSPQDEFDPDVQKKVDKRAEEEFQRTTPQPSTKAVVRPKDEDGTESDSSGNSEDD